MQTVFYHIVRDLTKLLTPILPHSAEEMWSYLQEDEKYVQLSEFPEVQSYANEEEIKEKWSKFMKFRDHVLKANEVARENKVIGKDFEAKTTVYATEEVKALLDSLNSDIRQILIASEFTVKDISEKPEDDSILDFETVSIKVEHMPGEVCTRCRITTEEYTAISDEEVLCQRCYDICEKHYPEVLS